MGLLFGRQSRANNWSDVVGERSRRTGTVSVTAETSLRQSSVWAALVLRADLVSTMPVDIFRKVGDVRVEVPKTAFFLDPEGNGASLSDWLFATQFDLDQVGNSYGLIAAKDSFGIPARIELLPHTDVTVLVDKTTGVVRYRVNGYPKPFEADEIWHERANPRAGMVMGMSPVANAAWSLGLYQSAAEFALEWFANGGTVPNALLKNTKKTLLPGEADSAKQRFKASIVNRDVFVTGNDWEYSTINAAQSDSKFLEAQNLSDVAAARYFGVPADMIDVPVEGSHITYASVAAKNLQFLITKLGPALTRREISLTKLVADPRFVKFNRGALLQMDPETQSKVLLGEIAGGLTTSTEARAFYDRPPLTPSDLSEITSLTEALGKQKSTTGVPA